MSSKRKHRSKESRAFSKGYQAGKKGRSKDNCPYVTNMTAKQLWLNGWRAGWADSKFGGYRTAEFGEAYYQEVSGF